MTEPPRDDERRPQPGAPQPYGPGAQAYGEPPSPMPPSAAPPSRMPPSPGPPARRAGLPADFNRPYGQPSAGPARSPHPGQSGAHAQYGFPGQPSGAPHGGAPQAPARKRRTGLIAGLAALLVLLVAGGVVAAMTLGPRILSREAVERDVARQFEELHGVEVDIECPDDMVLESGAEFRCTGETDEGEEIEIEIAVTDPPGDAEYTWTEI